MISFPRVRWVERGMNEMNNKLQFSGPNRQVSNKLKIKQREEQFVPRKLDELKSWLWYQLMCSGSGSSKRTGDKSSRSPGSVESCWGSRNVVSKTWFPVDWLVRFGWASTSFVALEVAVTDWGRSRQSEVGQSGNRSFSETATNNYDSRFRAWKRLPWMAIWKGILRWLKAVMEAAESL